MSTLITTMAQKVI